MQQTDRKPGEARDLEDLLRESQRVEDAWAQVKGRLRQAPVPAGPTIPLEQLIPLEFEQAIADMDDAAEQVHEEEPDSWMESEMPREAEVRNSPGKRHRNPQILSLRRRPWNGILKRSGAAI